MNSHNKAQAIGYKETLVQAQEHNQHTTVGLSHQQSSVVAETTVPELARCAAVYRHEADLLFICIMSQTFK